MPDPAPIEPQVPLPRAFITGCAGYRLSAEEVSFFKQNRPFGLILFARNCRDPEQVRQLTSAFRDAAGRADAPVLIDQEGGRVQRLRPPHWLDLPPAGAIGRIYEQSQVLGREAAACLGRILAAELAGVGINVDCMPLLDIPAPGGHEIIGDRAFSTDADIIIDAAHHFIDGLVSGGCLPVIKHIPGHGRAGCDSHKALPVVDTAESELEMSDFKPFTALKSAPFAMTAHVVYSAIDADFPATTSSKVIRHIIRGKLGFSGLLMSDDLSMQALEGSIHQRAAACFAAGCDLALHCNGELPEMIQVAAAAPELGESRLALYAEALKQCGSSSSPEDVSRLRTLVAGAGGRDGG